MKSASPGHRDEGSSTCAWSRCQLNLHQWHPCVVVVPDTEALSPVTLLDLEKKKKPQLKHLYGCACMCVYRRLRVVSAGLAYFSGQKEQVACCFTRRQINLTGVSSSRHRSGQKRTTASWPDSCSVGWLKTPHNQTITRTLGSATAASNSGPLGCSGVAQILLLDEMLFFNQL